MYIYVIRTSRWLRLTGASKVDTIFWQIMLPLEERCNNSEGFESWAWRVTVNYEGTELQTACTKGLGAGGAKRGYGSPPVCAESTQHCKETQHKEGGLAPPRERKLGSYSGITRHHTQEENRKRKLPTHSLSFLQGTTRSDPWGPLPLGCGRKFVGKNAHFLPTFTKACSRHWIAPHPTTYY